jgi:type II secretory pathway pseudopilin PulG
MGKAFSMNPFLRQREGYILLETLVAVVVLGLGSVMVHSVLRQGIQTRGQAQDITQARFLLEDLVAQIELQPKLLEGTRQGYFEDANYRFSYSYDVRKINFSPPASSMRPEKPNDSDTDSESDDDSESTLTPERREQLLEQLAKSYLVQVNATVTWSRAGMPFGESMELLLGSEHLYEPPKEKG